MTSTMLNTVMSDYPDSVFSPLVLIILTLAVARMCVLMTTDTITEPWRRWVVAKLGEKHMLTRGAGCNWCWSIWFSFGMGAITFTPNWHEGWQYILASLAVSFVASYLADKVS